MPSFTVRKGKRYQAVVSLGWIEQIASNEMVAQPIRDAGFTDVQVEGEGSTRHVTAVWPGEDATADIPSQVTDISEIEV